MILPTIHSRRWLSLFTTRLRHGAGPANTLARCIWCCRPFASSIRARPTPRLSILHSLDTLRGFSTVWSLGTHLCRAAAEGRTYALQSGLWRV